MYVYIFIYIYIYIYIYVYVCIYIHIVFGTTVPNTVVIGIGIFVHHHPFFGCFHRRTG